MLRGRTQQHRSLSSSARRRLAVAALFAVCAVTLLGRDEEFAAELARRTVRSLGPPDDRGRPRLSPAKAAHRRARRRAFNNRTADDFCPHCNFLDGHMTCGMRVDYLMKVYGSTEEEARAGANVTPPACRLPESKVWLNTYAERDEPAVHLHIGPHKTGTTALQAFIYDTLHANETLFLEDNIRVPKYEELPGTFAKEGVGLNLAHCCIIGYKGEGGGQMNCPMCSRMRDEFPLFMIDAWQKGQDVLIAAEDFDRKEIDFERLEYFLRPYSRIKVYATYRRLHEWLPSWYNQIVAHYTTSIYSQGREHYPSFVEWFGAEWERFRDNHAISLLKRYEDLPFVESVDIVNMHSFETLRGTIENFFCAELKARAVCQALMDGAGPSKTNQGKDHELERVVIAAALAGKLKTDISKPLYLNRIAGSLGAKIKVMLSSSSLPSSSSPLPTICVDKNMTDEILRLEAKYERLHFREWHEGQGGEESLRRAFQKAVRRKFCVYDVEKILDEGLLDDVWPLIDNHFGGA